MITCKHFPFTLADVIVPFAKSVAKQRVVSLRLWFAGEAPFSIEVALVGTLQLANAEETTGWLVALRYVSVVNLALYWSSSSTDNHICK